MRKVLILALFICFLATLSLTGCSNNNPTGPTFTGDDFNSYPTGAWADPPNGWSSLNNKTWSIVAEGVTGNALWFVPNEKDIMVHASDTQDYTLSVQIKHASGSYGIIPTITYYASLVGRCTGINSYYGCCFYNYTYTNITVLMIEKYWMDDQGSHSACLESVQWFSGAPDKSTYYTLTLKCQGNMITATASGGGKSTVTISTTDDGGTNGPVLTSGKVGLCSSAEDSFHPYFDNFTVSAL